MVCGLRLSLSFSLSHAHTLSLTCTQVQCTFPLWSLMVGHGLCPHQNTCTHVTASPQYFCGEHDALPEAAQYKLLKEVFCTHIHVKHLYTKTCAHSSDVQYYSLSLSCIYTHTDHHIHVRIPSHAHSWHVHTFASVDLCVLEADWRRIGLTEAGLSSSRC